jgi:hypothetical protein
VEYFTYYLKLMKFMNAQIYSLDFNTNSEKNKCFLGLRKGVLAFPDIDYSKNNKELGETKRLRASIRKIHTILSDAGYLSHLLHAVDPASSSIADEIKKLESAIINAVKTCRSCPSDQLTHNIFHSIQYWGGGEGRSIYVKPKERGDYRQRFNHNFGDGSNYKIFIDRILKENESRDRKSDDLGKVADSIENWGLSFASKHMNFVSKAVSGGSVPRWFIFDSIISSGCFGESIPNWKSYVIYCREMEKCAADYSVSADQFERALFNYFQDDPVGQLWGALRCR